MADEKSTVLGIRLDTEERKRFDDFVNEEGKNNKDFMSTLLNLYELNKGKVKNINLVGDIETLEGYTNKIHQTFINIIDKLESQKEGILENSDKNLQIYKDKVNNLQNEFDAIKSVNSLNEEKLTNINNVMLTLEGQNKALNESLQDKLTIIKEYQGKNDTLTGIVEEYKQYKTDIEEYKQLLQDSYNKNMELKNTIKDKNFDNIQLNTDLKAKDIDIDNLNLKHAAEVETLKKDNEKELEQLRKDKDFIISNLNKDIDKLKQKSINTIEELNSRHIEELEAAKDKASIIMDKALLAERKTNQEQLSQEQLKHNKEIETYQNKYKQLLEELEKVRAVPVKKDKAAATTK